MRRTQIQLDEGIYEELRQRAHQRGISMSAFLRELLHQSFGTPRSARRVEDFAFVGIGRSKQAALAPVSERHDDALAEAYRK